MEPYVIPSRLQPDIWLWGLQISEPVTALTALLISLTCLWCWSQLRRPANPPAYRQYFRLFFALMGFATLLGGIVGHAFLYAVPFSWKIPGWVLGMVAIAALERGAILHAQPLMHPAWGRFFSIFNLVEISFFLVLTLSTLNFHFVEFHAGYGLVVVVGIFEGYVYYRTRDAGSRLLLSAIPLAAVAAALHVFKISLSPWFNYFDMGHLIMVISSLIMVEAVKRMRAYKRGRKTLDASDYPLISRAR